MSTRDNTKTARSRNDVRSTIACDRCRQKRKRCDGQHPVCGSCQATGWICQWPERKRRGRKVETVPRDEESGQVILAGGSSTSVSCLWARSMGQTVTGTDIDTGQLGRGTPGLANGSLLPIVSSNTEPRYMTGEGSEEDIGFYYRIGGNTALQPGLQRIRVRARPIPISDTSRSEEMLIGPPIDTASIVDDMTGLPTTVYFRPLLEAFFANLGQFHPSIQRGCIDQAFKRQKLSRFLALSIAAVAAPFTEQSVLPKGAGDAYFDMAKNMTIESISVPNINVCEGCLLLAWCSFARNEESLCWQYFGMGARMALDLGFHRTLGSKKTPHSEDTSDEQTRSLCFWTVVMMDRFLTLIRGMHITIPERPIEIALPEAANLPTVDMEGRGNHVTPFPRVVQLMIHAGRIANAINEPTKDAQLARRLQSELLDYHQSLPPHQAWSVDIFASHAKAHQSGAYLLLHVWREFCNGLYSCLTGATLKAAAYATLALLQDQHSVLLNPDEIHSPNTVSLSCARTICDRFVTADLTDPESYLGTIYLIQPLFIASKIFLAEIIANKYAIEEDPLQNLSVMIARQNLEIMAKGLKKMAVKWSGVEYPLSILRDLAKGAEESSLFDTAHNNAPAAGISGQSPSIWLPTFAVSGPQASPARYSGNPEPTLTYEGHTAASSQDVLSQSEAEDVDPWSLEFSDLLGLLGDTGVVM